jgi:hypothetical protein
VDVLARDVKRARAWQTATSAIDRAVDRVPDDAEPLLALQAALVRGAAS